MIFLQLFDPTTSTYTYIVADGSTKQGLLIDPVYEQADRDLAEIKNLGVHLEWILETHVHADHVTGASLLREKTKAKIGMSKLTGAEGADRFFNDGDFLTVGSIRIQIISTPGHTNGCTSYFIPGLGVFTGDALMINGCGRTDFQQGSSEKLFESVRTKLFTLPDNTVVYPAHDYKEQKSSTIGQEKKSNPRLKLSNTKDEFIEIMNNLKLDYPKQIDRAVPANMKCGKI